MASRPLVPNGTYRIKSESSNVYLDCSPTTGSVTAQLVAATSQSQQWTISPARDGDYGIKSATNGEVLGINSQNQLFCGSLARRATWTIEPRGSDAYVIGSALNARAIQRPGGNGPVTAEIRDNGTHQRWSLEPDPLGLNVGTPPKPTDINLPRRVIGTLPLSARSATNSSSFHIIKLPRPDGSVYRLQQVVVEFCIQSLATSDRQAIWWTCYVVLAPRGTLTRESGIYTEWGEFGSFSIPQGSIVATVTPRTSGIFIADIHKGVLNSRLVPNETVLRVVDLSGTRADQEIFVVLVASGMHDGGYQVHGQARLEYLIRNNLVFPPKFW